MRLLRFAGAAVLSAAVTFAMSSSNRAYSDQTSNRALADATAHLEKGNDLLAEVAHDHTNAVRLETLDRSLYFLRRSRTLALTGDGPEFQTLRADASQNLVRALDDEAEIYYQRKSLWMAHKRLDEAVGIDPADARARNLVGLVNAAESKDIYSDDVGTVAIERIRGRRAAMGIPLRDRGIGLRR